MLHGVKDNGSQKANLVHPNTEILKFGIVSLIVIRLTVFLAEQNAFELFAMGITDDGHCIV